MGLDGTGCDLPGLEVCKTYDGGVILLTGATGFIGSVVLEHILRLFTGVKKVYLVVRPKEGCSPETRLDRLLEGPQFSLVRDALPELRKKLHVLPTDLTSSAACDFPESVIREVNFVIHCASAIRFDLSMRDTMAQVYCPTKALLEAAARMPALKAFCYMSSASANPNRPRNSTVEEIIYPLGDPAAPTDGIELAESWLSAPADQANAEANEFQVRWGFMNAYMLAKNLTERLVASYEGRLPGLLIVRPTAVGALAEAPCPGFIGNSSGFTGAMIAGAYGILGNYVAWDPNSRVPLVPGDIVAAATLVATAAAAQGKAQRIYNICTSTSFPCNLQTFHRTIFEYRSKMDPPRVPSLNPQNRPQQYVSDGIWLYLHNWWHGFKIWLVSTLLSQKGNQKLANKLRMGWASWRELNTRAKDMNFAFCTAGTDALQKMLGGTEGRSLKCVWREDLGDDWGVYLRTYAAGVYHLMLRSPPRPSAFSHHKYRPVGEKVKA